MDTQTIVIVIIALLQVIILPWAVFITLKSFELEKHQAIYKQASINDGEKIEELKEEVAELSEKVEAMPLKIVEMIRPFIK